MAELYTNNAKARLLAGEKLSAAWSQTGSTVTAEILAQAGFDMIVVDCEHAPIDPPQLLPIVQAAGGYGSMIMARAPWNDLVAIKRMLDCGIQGIHIPYVNNVEETARAVRACKYPPLGNRGIAGSPRAAGYGANRGQYLQRANDEILVLVALETPEAVVDHLFKLRGQQDKSGGFKAFVPLPFRKGASDIESKGSGVYDLKICAIARLVLDNFSHIRVPIPHFGDRMAQILLNFGADDIGGTHWYEEVAAAAGAMRLNRTEDFMRKTIIAAGFKPVKGTSNYGV